MNHVGIERGGPHGARASHRRALELHPASTARSEGTTFPVSRPQANRQPTVFEWNPLRAEDRHPLGGSSSGDGMQRHDLLEPPSRLAGGGSLGQDPSGHAQPSQRRRLDRLGASDPGLLVYPRLSRGGDTGPNPTDRAKLGCKHNLIVDGNGLPLAALLTQANRNDTTQILPLVDAVPFVAGKPGHPRRRPDSLYADRGYDSEPHRETLRDLGIEPFIAKRGTPHGSGLGKVRWVVERTIAWLHRFRRLRVRYERRADIHDAFLKLGCALICWNQLEAS